MRDGRWPIAVYTVVVVSLATSPVLTFARDVDQPVTPLAQVGGGTVVPDRVATTASPAIVPSATRTATPRSRPVRRGPSNAWPAAPPEATATEAIKDLDLGPAVLRSAFDAADQDYARSASRTAFGTDPASRQARTDRAFDAAQIEGCGSNPLKFDPLPVWGDFVIGGPLLVLPYMLHAVATGRCKL